MAKHRAAAKKKSKPRKAASKAHRVAHPPGALGRVKKTSPYTKYLKTPQDRLRYNKALKEHLAEGYMEADAKHMALLPFIGEAEMDAARADDVAYENKMKTMASRLKRWFR